MAKITELEESNPEKSSFPNYLWTVISYILCILAKPIVVLRELFSKRVEHRNVEHKQLMVITCKRNQIDNRLENGFSLDFTSRSVASLEDVYKLLGGQFKRAYFGFTESPQTPSDTYINHVIVINLPHSPNSAKYTFDSEYEQIMEKLTRLQDNGDFDEFEKYSSALLVCYGNTRPDIATAVLIEQARCMLYRDRVPRAKFLARKSLKFAESNACSGMYIARAHLVISACYRRKGKLGKAKRSLDTALKNLVNTAYYEDWCRYYDACGSYFNGISDTVTQPGETVLEKAKECFFKQLQAAERESRKNLHNQKFFARLKIARTLLDANTIFGQQRKIPDNDVTTASKYLDDIEREFCDGVARGKHMQFMLIRVKQYYRQQRFSEAVPLLKKCIALATDLGYERDKMLMVDGLKLLTVKAEQERSETSCAEKDKDKFGTSSEGGSHLESFDSASDSIEVFDSELGDSC